MLDWSIVYCRGPHNVDGFFLPQLGKVWDTYLIKIRSEGWTASIWKMLIIGLPMTFVDAQICHIPICVFFCDISNISFS